MISNADAIVIGSGGLGAATAYYLSRRNRLSVYMRPCQGGFLWGVFEEAPRFFDMQALGPNFDVKDMPARHRSPSFSCSRG